MDIHEEADKFSDIPPTTATVPQSTPSIAPTPSIEKSTSSNYDINLIKLTSVFEQNLNSLRQEKSDLIETIDSLKSEGSNNQTPLLETIEALNKNADELRKANNIGYLLSQVNENVQRVILQENEIIENFNSTKTQEAFILSIDIRKSTDLMLKCKSPQLFSLFIKELCESLKEIIISNYGVFDKFTGDGILAFFPTFFSGINADYLILKSAFECRNKFNEIYEKHRASFQLVIADTGLGIGIDFGEVCIINFNNYYTAVGVPVVYACRLSSTKANTIVLNQLAYNEIYSSYSDQLLFQKIVIDIKNEGPIKAFLIESESAFDLTIIPEAFKNSEN